MDEKEERLYKTAFKTFEEIQKRQTIKDVILYHYTSAAGLLNIVESGRFWATHYKFLNDPQEITYSIDLIAKVFKENLEKFNIPHEYEFELIPEYLKGYISQHYDFYITGFSSSDDILSQWRAYGDNGDGYSIGIRLSNIQCLDEELPFGSKGEQSERFCVVKLIYDPEEQKKTIIDTLTIILKNFNDIDVDESDKMKFCRILFSYILEILSILFKNQSFKEEAEWRFVGYRQAESNTTKIKYRNARHDIIPYIELDFSGEPEGPMPICSIRCGPKQNLGKSRIVLERLLRSKGYKEMPEILESSIPYA